MATAAAQPLTLPSMEASSASRDLASEAAVASAGSGDGGGSVMRLDRWQRHCTSALVSTDADRRISFVSWR